MFSASEISPKSCYFSKAPDLSGQRRRLIHMKKTLSLLLVLLMLASVLVSCGGNIPPDAEIKGAQITLYLANEIRDFDPGKVVLDDDAADVMNLVYSGLVSINDEGKVNYDLMEEYTTEYDKVRGTYKMYITLKETKWSDGRNLTADDVIFAWKRILDPEYDSPAATLLYDIKNARDVKNGDCSVDDLGLAAVDKYMLEVEFDKNIDYNLFIERLASPALVPLREDVVVSDSDWAKKSSSLVTNGPFAVKNLESGDKDGYTLERNSYYLRDKDDDNLDKYVIPYRIIVKYALDTEAKLAAIEEFNNGQAFYIGDIPIEKRTELKKKIKSADIPSIHTYIVNTENELLSTPEVRKALSMALDRDAIAKLVVFAKPATGFVPSMTSDKSATDSFRKNGKDVISSKADVQGAKALLDSAGVKGASFTLSYYNSESERAIAEYAANAWKELGFDVKLKELSNSAALYNAYDEAKFDILAVDYQMLSKDPFNTFASYSSKFSGMGIGLQYGNFDLVPHISGYVNEIYDELMENAYASTSRKDRSTFLHEAEKLLAEDMPVIPVIFNQDFYLINSSVISGEARDYFGGKYFSKLEMEDYEKYLTE